MSLWLFTREQSEPIYPQRNMIFLLACHSLTLEGRTTSNGKGEIDIILPIQDQNSFMVMAQSDNFLVVKELYAPDGSLILSNSDVAFNWPIRREDSELYEGDWRLTLACYDPEGYPASGVPIDVRSRLRHDENLEEALLLVRVVQDTQIDEPTQNAIQQAVSGWSSIWAEFGISLEVRFESQDLPSLPLIYLGSSEVEALHTESNEDELLVIIGEQFEDAPDVLGFAGSVPGSILPSPRSAVVISWLNNAGADGVFSEGEIQLFSETLAHEAGHYLGLYHPVEMEYNRWDALEDTEECSAQLPCHAVLKDNLMFPYPICSENSCVQQNLLTSDQQAVLHRYTGLQ